MTEPDPSKQGLLALHQDEFEVDPRHDMDAFRKGPVFLKLLVPRKLLSRLIGRGGRMIDDLEEINNVKVLISDENTQFLGTNHRIMLISGEEDDIADFLFYDDDPKRVTLESIVNELAAKGDTSVLRDPDNFRKGGKPDVAISVVIPRNCTYAILGEHPSIDTDDCVVTLVDPDPAEEEFPEVLLATCGPHDKWAPCLMDIAALLADEAAVHTKDFLTVAKYQLERNLDALYYSSTLFWEVFQETSAGDFGVELIPEGPLFRAHTSVLQIAFPGFLQKIREEGKRKPLSGAPPQLNVLDALRKVQPRETRERLLNDAQFSAFSQPANLTSLQKAQLEADIRARDNSHLPTAIGPTIGAIRRRDPFLLAERFAVEENVEHMIELFRFMYQGKVCYFQQEYLESITPEMRLDIWFHVREMLFLSEKYAVDRLFKRCLEWFSQKCMNACGEKAIANAFYQLEHHVEKTKEPMFKQALRQVVITLLSNRAQMRAVTGDPRWSTLQCRILRDILAHPKLAIASELEVLQLIKRWDAQTDKPKPEVKILLSTFRPDFTGGMEALGRMAHAYGFEVEDIVPREQRYDLLDQLPPWMRAGHKKKAKPRSNIGPKNFGDDVSDGDTLMEEHAMQDAAEAEEELRRQESKAKKEKEQTHEFAHMVKDTRTRREEYVTAETGFAFSTFADSKITATHALRAVNNYRVRVTLSQMQMKTWAKHHRVFVGASFGDGSFFGYTISLSDFQGIYRVQFESHREVDAENEIEGTDMTGSATMVEFDLQIDVNHPRTDGNLWCDCTVLMNTAAIKSVQYPMRQDLFLKHGMRFEAYPLFLEKNESLDIQLAWVVT